MNLPENVMTVLKSLHDNDFSAYVVGGCVRDFVLGKEPKDYDIATSARPEQVMEVFKDYEVIPTGLQHGTVTIMVNGQPIEVTTYRLDGEYKDCRRPNGIVFLASVEDDLMRRDFKMNAIAYNPWVGLVDPYGGINDIVNCVVQCVGNAKNRFNEDALRILRALRFSAQLRFDIEEETSNAIHDCKHLLDNISKERIQNELVKILMSDNGGKVLSEYRDVLYQIIPEFERMEGFVQEDHYYKNKDMLEHTLCCADSYDLRFNKSEEWNDIILRLAILFHDIGKPYCCGVNERGIQTFEGHADISAKMTYKILKDLKFSNEIVAYTTQLVSYHEFDFDGNVPQKVAVKKLLNKIGEVQLRRLIALQKCDLHEQILLLTDNRRICFVQMAEAYLDEVVENDECYSLKQLTVNGDDLIEIGVPQGKEVGVLLNKLLDMIVNGNVENDRLALLNIAKEMIYI